MSLKYNNAGVITIVPDADGSSATGIWDIDIKGNSFSAEKIKVSYTNDNSAHYVTFLSSSLDGNQSLKFDSDMYYNPYNNSLTASTFIGTLNGKVLTFDDISIMTPGKTIKVKQGSDSCMGIGAKLIDGTVTINTSAIETGDMVITSATSLSGIPGIISVSIVNGVSFTLNSSSSSDTSTYSWIIIKPA